MALKSQKKRRKLSVAIIVDLMGTSMASSEEEIAEHKRRFSLILSDFELEFVTPRCVMPDMVADLVIYDFGGMMPGTSLMEDNSRAVIKWAGDHPSSLVVVVSSYTFCAYIRPELLALGLTEILNVIPDNYDDDTLPGWFMEKK